MAVTIDRVKTGTPAHRAGLAAGDTILTIDGVEINDMLDYEFYTAKAELCLGTERCGRRLDVKLKKGEYEPLGCDFDSYLIDRQHSCRNKCMFCFIDQLPKGMRETLYFKDDDERLSFLYGNYVTLTNLQPPEIERIIRMRISPINISVHTTDPQLRVQMMKNPRAGEVLSYLDRLAEAGIEMNFQIVLCPGINDGDRLRETLEKLTGYYPATQSVAVVPVGLTRYREGLPVLRPFDAASAAEAIDLMERVGRECLQKYGDRLVYPSDEFFLMAGRPVPPQEYYGVYPQLENGVGMWRLLHEEFMQARQNGRPRLFCRAVDVVTGESAAPLLEELAQSCREYNPRARITVHCIKNDFFGGNVSVTGLLTGADLLAQLSGRLDSRDLVLPRNVLRAEKDLFLDNVSVAELEQKLGVKVHICELKGQKLLQAMQGHWKEK